MVVGGCKSFLLLVTTQNEVNNCAKVALDGRQGHFVLVSRTNFNKIHIPLTLLTAFSHTFSKNHKSRMSFNFFFFHVADKFLPLLRVMHKPSLPSVK